MPSWYKNTWKLVNEIIAIKNNSQHNNKLFEDSENQKQCEDLNNFFSGWKIPFYKNETIPYHSQTFY